MPKVNDKYWIKPIKTKHKKKDKKKFLVFIVLCKAIQNPVIASIEFIVGSNKIISFAKSLFKNKSISLMSILLTNKYAVDSTSININ